MYKRGMHPLLAQNLLKGMYRNLLTHDFIVRYYLYMTDFDDNFF